ncbi:MAG: alpha/beta fold hydrolase, partial [Actinomycetota bacterium]
MGRQAVEFVSEGAVVRGWFFTPDGSHSLTPAIVMVPGFSASSRFTVFDLYAEAFADIGVAALLVDARGFGLSDGEPRHEINVWNQARDYRAAIEFLHDMDGIDPNRIAVWGVSLSAAVAAVVAAVDPRVAAAVLQVPAFGDDLSPHDSDGSRFASIRDTVLDADLGSFERTVDGPLPIVSPTQLSMPSFVRSLTAFHWFINYGARYGTGWENQATVA